jgi:hypothetical protein
VSGSRYDFTPLFAARLTGVPFEELETLATPESSRLARELLAHEREVTAAKDELLGIVRSLGLPRTIMKRISRALQHHRLPAPEDAPDLATARFASALAAHARAAEVLETSVAADEVATGARVQERSLAVLPDFLALESESAYEALVRPWGKRDRNKERHFALYLQRVCAKNDTISRFGPVIWGRVDPALRGARIEPRPGIARRMVKIERWVVATLVEAINRDANVRAELAPRIHPAFDREHARREDTGVEVALDRDDRALLDRCDGRTPAHALGQLERLARLADDGALIWTLELVAWDDDPLDTLQHDIRAWRSGPLRDGWLTAVGSLAELGEQFARELAPAARQQITARARDRIIAVGGALPTSERTLYHARNIVVEECSREGDVALGQPLIDRLMTDLTPWLDLYRDAYSMAVAVGFDHVSALIRETPRRDGRTNLAALVAASDATGESLRNEAPQRWGREAFHDVVHDFTTALAGRATGPELAITAHDCHVLRRTRQFTLIDEGSWASADLMLAARSTDAVEAGDYRWLVGELHYMLTPLHQAIAWCCPDREALARAYRDFEVGRPWLLLGRKGFLRSPVHTSFGRLPELIPNCVYGAIDRAPPHWRQVPPSEIDVVTLEDERDIRARHRGTGEDLGSLIRVPWVFQGISSFTPFEQVPHSPRLLIDRTVVQRRTWRVRRDELGTIPDGSGSARVVAVERMRADRDIPRWVYIRPPKSVLQRTDGIGAQDKEAKPMYVDLEAYVFVDLFLRRLVDHEELEVVEMLPAPDELLWREPTGRYCFELRTMCPPAVRKKNV